MKEQKLELSYTPKLSFFETETAIILTKETFEKALAKQLNLIKVSAPKFLPVGTGLQDDLAGTQTPVSFKVKFSDKDVEVVHSLAKWKRYTLGRHAFKPHTGLLTDMAAIRKDEDISEIHSIYVDQWDWEVAITKEDRTIMFLKEAVQKIYAALLETESVLEKKFPKLGARLPKTIHFTHSEELEAKYPMLSPKEREDAAAKEFGAVFIIGIGHPLKSGEPHDVRAADYDDWSTPTAKGLFGLNGDILVWDAVRGKALELSSMGIRVDAAALDRQLAHAGLSERKKLAFHKGILSGELPLSIGGGIGQSRVCMLLLHKAHIGEVQSSYWPEEEKRKWTDRGALLL